MSNAATAYDQDYYAWAQDQADRLRGWPEHLRPNGLDIQNLVEEIEQLSRSEEARLTSLLRQLFLQLLKLEFHPSHRSRRHWMREVNAFRVQIQRFGDPRPRRGGPKLWSERHTWAADAWSDAVRQFRADLVSGERDSTLQHLADAQVTADRPRYDLDGTTLDPAWYPAPWPESDRT